MTRSRLHLFALFVAFCTLVLVMTGAAVTSSRNQPAHAVLEITHIIAAVAQSPLIVGLLIWLSLADKRAWLIRFGWLTIAACVIDAWSGTRHASPVIGTLHASLAAVLFAAVAAIARFTSRSWQCEPELVQDYGWPSLRFLSGAAALLVAVQVGFGAGFRHSAVGVMPHLLGALLVALFIMIVGAFATNQFPKHPVLRPLAVALMTITGIQVFLGMAAFLMRLMETAAPTAFLVISVAHIGMGSLTLAASVILAIEVRRNVLPRARKTP